MIKNTKEIIVDGEKYTIQLLSNREWANMTFATMNTGGGDVMYDYLPKMLKEAPGLKLKKGETHAPAEWVEEKILPETAMQLYTKAFEFQQLDFETRKNLSGRHESPAQRKTKKGDAKSA